MEFNIINIEADNTKTFASILNRFLSGVKMMHWYTSNYNVHEILGSLYDDLSDLFDALQEEIIGTAKQSNLIDQFPLFSKDSIKDEEYSGYTEDYSIINQYTSNQNALKDILNSSEFKSYVDASMSGIMNTKDEIISRINKTNYLLNMVKL
jgi:DNA-binding ferritin-like protein